jgi:hypothetical protein
MMSSYKEQTLGVDDVSLDSSKSPKRESSSSSRRFACKEGGGELAGYEVHHAVQQQPRKATFNLLKLIHLLLM